MSIPDLDKIVKMSDLFGVSTDCLLKDNLEIEEISESQNSKIEEEKKLVTMEEAHTYINIVEKNAIKMAIGVGLCVISPITLILLGGIAEYKNLGITEDMAGGFGVAILLMLVAVAVSIFILSSMKLSKYEYLEKEIISLQYGVEGYVTKKKEDYGDTYRLSIVIGVVLCILGIVPLFIAVGMGMGDFVYVCCTAVLLLLIAIGTVLFVNAGTKWDCYNKLLQVDDYRVESKKRMKKYGPVIVAYWCIVTAIFLGASFATEAWEKVGLIWPVAGVLFAALMAILKVFDKEDKR